MTQRQPRFPEVPTRLWCLEHAVFFQMAASEISQVGELLRSTWMSNGIRYYCDEQDARGRISLKVQQQFRFFQRDGAFHQALKIADVALTEFVRRPSIKDPASVFISPTLVLAAIQYNYVFTHSLSDAVWFDHPPTIVLHWTFGSEDWYENWCPLPLFMVGLVRGCDANLGTVCIEDDEDKFSPQHHYALGVAFQKAARATSADASTTLTASDVIDILNKADVRIATGHKGAVHRVRVHFASPSRTTGMVLLEEFIKVRLTWDFDFTYAMD